MIQCILSNEELIYLSKALFFFIHSWLNGENYGHCFLQVSYMHDEVMNYLTAKVNKLNPNELSDDDKRLCVLYYLIQTTVYILKTVFNHMRSFPVFEVFLLDKIHDSPMSLITFVATVAMISRSPRTSL